MASLFVWHFCEEIEHRSSALMIYDEAVGSYWYRIKNFLSYMRHVKEGMDLVQQKFKQHVPGIPQEWYRQQAGIQLPLRDRLNAFMGIVLAQLPGHNPENQIVPLYYKEWLQLEADGKDLTRIIGVLPAETAT